MTALSCVVLHRQSAARMLSWRTNIPSDLHFPRATITVSQPENCPFKSGSQVQT